MALERKDHIGDTTTTTGTGTISLDAVAQTGARIFAGNVTSGATVRYEIRSVNGTEWEVGEGVFADASPDTLTRVTVYASSNGGSLVNFSAGTKNVSMVATVKDHERATGAEINTGTETDKIVTPQSITDSYLSNVYVGMARQAIMNGNFDVWQRGTSFTPLDVTEVISADRWKDYTTKDGGTLPTLTRSRQLLTSGDITNAFYFSRLNTNGAGTSLGVNSRGVFYQRVENGVRNLCGNGKKVTVSFWAKSDIANKRLCPTLEQVYGSGGSPSATEIIKGTPITLTNTWTKYTATLTTNTLSGKTFGTNVDDLLQVNFYYMWGTTAGDTYVQTSVTAETYVGSGNIDIAQVQLCAGDVALPFQPKSFEEELRQCQRYYEKSFQYATAPANAVGTVLGAAHQLAPLTTVDYLVHMKTRKAKIPTITVYNPINNDTKWRDTSTGSDIVSGIDQVSESVFLLTGTSSTVGRNYYIHWTANAEL